MPGGLAGPGCFQSGSNRSCRGLAIVVFSAQSSFRFINNEAFYGLPSRDSAFDLGGHAADQRGLRPKATDSSQLPEGAMAYVDDQEIGQTPVSTSFTHYGVRSIRLEKDGYETVQVQERLDAPWYLTPPLDFFVENFWPAEIRDEREVDFELQPAKIVPQSELLPRAEEQRRQVQQNLVVPLADEDGRTGLFRRR